MRAAVHTGPGLILVQDCPMPAIGPGELLVRVRGCGLCGSDLAKLRAPATVPAVYGHEVVGEVVEVGEVGEMVEVGAEVEVGAGMGEGASAYRAGDRVVVAHHVPCFRCHYCRRGSPSMCRAFRASNLDPGGFAEFVRVPAENVRHATFRVPASVPDVVASFTEPLACCVRALRRAGPAPGDVVMVVGLGAMGCLLLQLARRAGARVLGVDPLARRRELGSTLGTTAVVEPESATAALAELTEGRGADAAILTVGSPAVVREALGWVRDGGTVHLFVGEGEGRLPIGDVYRRELTLTATYSSSPADLAEAFELICTGAVRVAELCSHRLPFAALPEAVELMARREGLKVFVQMVSGMGA